METFRYALKRTWLGGFGGYMCGMVRYGSARFAFRSSQFPIRSVCSVRSVCYWV